MAFTHIIEIQEFDVKSRLRFLLISFSSFSLSVSFLCVCFVWFLCGFVLGCSFRNERKEQQIYQNKSMSRGLRKKEADPFTQMLLTSRIINFLMTLLASSSCFCLMIVALVLTATSHLSRATLLIIHLLDHYFVQSLCCRWFFFSSFLYAWPFSILRPVVIAVADDLFLVSFFSLFRSFCSAIVADWNSSILRLQSRFACFFPHIYSYLALNSRFHYNWPWLYICSFVGTIQSHILHSQNDLTLFIVSKYPRLQFICWAAQMFSI